MNFLAQYQAAREAEERRRMTHDKPQRHDRGPRFTAGDLARLAAETFTPYGNYMSARDAKTDFEAGDYGWGAFNALMALPGLGMLKGPGRAWRRFAARTPRNHDTTGLATDILTRAERMGLKSITLERLAKKINDAPEYVPSAQDLAELDALTKAHEAGDITNALAILRDGLPK